MVGGGRAGGADASCVGAGVCVSERRRIRCARSDGDGYDSERERCVWAVVRERGQQQTERQARRTAVCAVYVGVSLGRRRWTFRFQGEASAASSR